MTLFQFSKVLAHQFCSFGPERRCATLNGRAVSFHDLRLGHVVFLPGSPARERVQKEGLEAVKCLSLNMGQLNERQTMLSKNVLECTHRMSGLINDLLDVTRARFGAGLPVTRAMMNMGTVAEQIVNEVRVVHPQRSIELSVSGFLGGEWDKARIGQVFSNLLNNAMQYGSHSVPVYVGVRGDPKAVTITVLNDGAPIPADKIKMIFDPLTRTSTDVGAATTFGNLGLGLYITKEVVVAHEGTIGVTSSEAEGTTFTARLPRLQPEPVLLGMRRLA